MRILALSLLAAVFLAVSSPARAERDTVHFGSNIHIAPDSSVHDAVCFFCSVDAQGEIQGNVVVFFGNIRVAGRARHDVVSFFGNMQADNDAAIDNSLVSFFGDVQLGENVAIGNDMVAMFGSVHAPDSVIVHHNRVIQPGWMFWLPIVAICAVIYLIIHEFGFYRRRRFARAYPVSPNR